MEVPNKITIHYYEQDGATVIQIHSEEKCGEEGMKHYLQWAIDSLEYKERPKLKRIK